MTHHPFPPQPATPTQSQRVLVLQGGGALGSYQAGAYQALCHFDFEPEWVAGISIGAINAAIIAGNDRDKRVGRLKEFWEMVSSPVPWKPLLNGDHHRSAFNEASAALIAAFGVPGFFTPRFPPAPLWPAGSLQSVSYYDTAPLKRTLERLVDFDRINDLKTRLSVGAVGITTGNFTYFDNVEFKKQGKRIGPEHIMASGALPPGFPPVEIDGQFYWDGGLVSNTPLQWILEQQDLDTLAFQVDLWNARGDIPKDMAEVEVRQKEILYSSRTRAATARARDRQRLRGALKRILAKLPENFGQEEDVELLSKATERRSLNVVQLIYRARKYEGASKDYDFSRLMMEEHWASGYEDAKRALGHPEIFHRPRNAEAFASYDFGQG